MTTILVVDDNPQHLKLVRVLLEREGFDVLCAPDATRARQELEARHPPLVLMDVQLPGKSGLELASELRAEPRWQGLVIIAMTAYAMKADRDRALAAGCDDHVAKPIDVDGLLELVRAWLARR